MGGYAAAPIRDTFPLADCSLTCVISFLRSGVSTTNAHSMKAHFRNGKCNEECRANGSFRGDRGAAVRHIAVAVHSA